MELKWGFLRQHRRAISPFNRTAYGIEISYTYNWQYKYWCLLIAPLMELKCCIVQLQRRGLHSFNRTAYGIEI